MNRTRLGYLGRMLLSLFFSHIQSQKHTIVMQELDSNNHVLLDGGCGHGKGSNGFEHKTSWLVALDNDKDAITAYHKRFKASCVRGDLERLPFQANVFDKCVLQDCLEHTKNPANVLRGIGLVLKANGEVVATVPNWYNRFFDFNVFTAELHESFHSSRGWKKLFEKVGYNCHVSCVAFPVLNKRFFATHFHLFGMCVLLKAARS